MEVITHDLNEFGNRQLLEVARLIEEYGNKGADFLTDKISINLNKNSGYVFLSDEDFNVGMLNNGKLEQWFSCPYCGHENFKENMEHEPQDEECKRYLEEIGVKDGN